MSRRDFLRRGALITGALAAGLPEAVSLLHPKVAEAAIMGIGQELRDVLNEETVNRILQEALARGGDAADVFAEQR
ncbi:MAG TPA: twin-arginine translocation signal domain-containing protein, partial [Methylomirabilota bacterium]|nr:twin-arginine translocation signal domain-containing protein [Methylomirabilota bacterium]